MPDSITATVKHDATEVSASLAVSLSHRRELAAMSYNDTDGYLRSGVESATWSGHLGERGIGHVFITLDNGQRFLAVITELSA